MNKRIDRLLVAAGAYFGGEGVVYDTFDPKKFAALVAAHEREACAKFFDDKDTNMFWGSQVAQQIRERGTT